MTATKPYVHISTGRTRLRLDWGLFDHAVSPHRLITSGRAWTRRGAKRQAQQAHDSAATRVAVAKTDIRDRRDDGLVW